MRGLGLLVVASCACIGGYSLGTLLTSGHPYQAGALFIFAAFVFFMSVRKAL